MGQFVTHGRPDSLFPCFYASAVRLTRDNAFLHRLPISIEVSPLSLIYFFGFFPIIQKIMAAFSTDCFAQRAIKTNNVNHASVFAGRSLRQKSPKMFGMSREVLVVLCVACVASVARCEGAEGGGDVDAKVRQGKIGLLSGATAMLGSLAQDLISRSAANSQVLSLNITNLFILLVLKALIFGAGAFGYGHGGYGRNVDNLLQEDISKNFNLDNFLSESELLLMLSYLKADSTQKFGCLQRVACEDPRRAKEYLFTGKLLLKGSEIFTQSPIGQRYDNILTHLEEAISFGLKGQDCSVKYQCEES